MVSGAKQPKTKIQAVLFCVFDDRAGPRLMFQCPDGSVATALSSETPSDLDSPDLVESLEESVGNVKATAGGTSTTQVLFDFNSSILHSIIPQPEMCNHLITACTRGQKILGFPIRIEDEKKYKRQFFIFNLCFVFDRDAELSGFEPIARKTGRCLRLIEESSSLLSNPPPGFSMPNLIEQIYLDINAFSETSITIETSPGTQLNLDLILYPFRPNPKEIYDYSVPLSVSDLKTMANRSWDVTLFRVIPFIDGINSVKRIAELAEVELPLARSCVQHLLYYSAIILVDLFRYSNSYTILPGFSAIAEEDEGEESATNLQLECEEYVYTGTGDIVTFAKLFQLYSSLAPGLLISKWMDQYEIDSLSIDVRRMIQFGVIKGFLRRVYTYPVWLDHPSFVQKNLEESNQHYSLDVPLGTTVSSTLSIQRSLTDAPAAPHVRTALPGVTMESEIILPTLSYPQSLKLMLDGSHHEEEICLKYGIGLKHLESILKDIGGLEENKQVVLLYI